MKLMNEIESDRDGVITEIVIENEQVWNLASCCSVSSKEQIMALGN